MKFRGFCSVQAFISEAQRLGFSIKTEHWALMGELQPAPKRFKAELHGREAFNTSDLRVVLIEAPGKSCTAVSSWHVFDSNYSSYFTDGIRTDYKELLGSMGYKNLESKERDSVMEKTVNKQVTFEQLSFF